MYTNKQGQCPYCNGKNLDYEPLGVEDSLIVYNYTCRDCLKFGQEWYELKFIGHNVFDENNNLIMLENELFSR